MSEEHPQTNLTFERMFCPRHGESLRANWPSGYPMLILKLLDILLKSEKFQKETEGDTTNIEKALDKHPACCRVSDGQMLKLYEEVGKETGFAVIAKCVNCKTKRLGTPYKTRHRSANHLCFHCVIYNMQPLQ